MKINLLFVLLSISLGINYSFAQEKILYKQIDSTKLYMDIYYPTKTNLTEKKPAMVFFFGGGWNGGTTSQFLDQAKYFSERGLVCFLVDYRTKTKNKTTPFESVKDAKSAMRFIRTNAAKFGIDPNKIIGAGGSAGGHLAASCALIDDYNEKTDDLSIDCKPNALVLFNPVIDNGPAGYGYERIGDAYKSFSPLHNIKKGAPPTIIFLGTKDQHIPTVAMEYYKLVMEKVGSRCDLKLYPEAVHGFFNKTGNGENYNSTVNFADEFLQSLGYLKPKN